EGVTITGTPYNGINFDRGQGVLRRVAVTGANNAGIQISDATVSVSDSLVRYSGYGIYVAGLNLAPAITTVQIERTRMALNTTGLSVQNGGGNSPTVRISDCVITGNTTGTTTGGGQIITFRNNAWAGNTTDGATPFSVSLK